MNSMNIKIKYFTDAIDRLAYIDGKSDWIDLRAAREVVLKKGDFALIPLGVAMELPKGYEAHPAYALRDTVIHVNDRICQFRIMEHQPKIVFEETEKLDNKDRGGIGSTGKN